MPLANEVNKKWTVEVHADEKERTGSIQQWQPGPVELTAVKPLTPNNESHPPKKKNRTNTAARFEGPYIKCLFSEVTGLRLTRFVQLKEKSRVLNVN